MADTRILEALQQQDEDAVEIIQNRSVVIDVGGRGLNLDEVVYRDRFGNEFRTFVEYK